MLIINDNIILDKLGNIKIPQNRDSNFLISKAEDWKNTIDLRINLYEEIDYLNLYIIVKSYLSSLTFPFPEILTRVLKTNDTLVTSRMNASLIIKMTYNEFQKWAQRRIHYDLRYVNEDNFYSFSFTANIFLVKNEDIAYLKPKYPWSENILKEIRSIELKEIIAEKKLLEKEKEINKLLKKIEDLEIKLKKRN